MALESLGTSYTGIGGASLSGIATVKQWFDFDWPDLQPIRNLYERQKGTPEAGFTHQIQCIAEKSIAESRKNGNLGWANGIVKYFFRDLLDPAHGGVPSSAAFFCAPRLDPLLRSGCFGTKTNIHGGELVKTFAKFCAYREKIADYHQIDYEHEKFLQEAVKPCFDKTRAAGELSLLETVYFKAKAVYGARLLRAGLSEYCPEVHDLLPLIRSRSTQNGPSDIDRFVRPTVSPIFEDIGTLTVGNTIGRNVALRVFTSLQLTVTKEENGISLDLTGHPDNTYTVLPPNEDLVNIDANGIAHAVAKGLPGVEEGMQDYIQVLVEHNGEVGVGQFTIIAQDFDEDGIPDYFDPSPAEPNPTVDTDADGITDRLELMIGSRPDLADSDWDGFSDYIEIGALTSPTDHRSFPVMGAEEPIFRDHFE